MFVSTTSVSKGHPRKALATAVEKVAKLLLGSGVSCLLSSNLLAAQIEEILVEEDQLNPYSFDESSLGKFTEPLRDTPQSITSISSQLLEDRAAMSLNDALRNVPGITLGAGEFSWQGNNPNIRGFSARNDMFLDGMRDFGSYDRDPFNLSSVEVLQGPSSMVFGRGSTGGVINQVSKTPGQDPLRSLHVNVGNANTRRIALDLNQPLSDGMAARLNLLKHDSEVPGRDGAVADRFGIAPSLSLMLGSATQLTLSYMKQHSENTPDYGLPWLAGAPAQVERSSYYGFDSDYIDTDADIATATIDHVLNDNTRLQAMVRYADYTRSTRITEPLLVGSVTATTPLDSVMVRRNVFQGESSEGMVQGQLNLITRVITGPVEHAIVTGLEVARENSTPAFGFGLGVPNTSLLNPGNDGFSSTGIAWRVRSDADADSLAGFILDTVKFNERWQLMGGIRWDRFAIDYRANRYFDDGSFNRHEHIERTDIKASYRAALVYKPVEQGSVYLGWGTSFNPSSEGLSFINSGRNLTISDAFLEPELNRSVELGTKWDLLDGALYIDAAIYRVVKTNARVPDPANPGFNILSGEQSVNGLSLNLTGRLSQQLSAVAGYTYLDSVQGSTTQATVLPGTPLANVPKNALSFWLNYMPAEHWELGLGTRYVDERLATIAQPLKSVPDYWAFDAMAKFAMNDNLAFKLNLTNLTDEFYFDQLHPWHVIPGPGLGAVFAINLDY